MSNQLVVIDPRVANYQSLIDQLGNKTLRKSGNLEICPDEDDLGYYG
jgi:hypothetical protein